MSIPTQAELVFMNQYVNHRNVANVTIVGDDTNLYAGIRFRDRTVLQLIAIDRKPTPTLNIAFDCIGRQVPQYRYPRYVRARFITLPCLISYNIENIQADTVIIPAFTDEQLAEFNKGVNMYMVKCVSNAQVLEIPDDYAHYTDDLDRKIYAALGTPIPDEGSEAI